MTFDDVLHIKQEFLSSQPSLQTLALETAGAPRGAGTRRVAARRDSASRERAGIALGVAPAKGEQYHLAVRLQTKGPEVAAAVEELRSRTAGEIDERYVGRLTKLAGITQPEYYQRSRRPLVIGSSISDVPDGFIVAGTLGCFVTRRESPHYLGILTNNHVIAGENENRIGSPIVQPGTLDGGNINDRQIGELGKFIRLRKRGANFVDGAVGDLYEDVEIDARTVSNLGQLRGHRTLRATPVKPIVYKVGRTTGKTKGRVTAFELDNVVVEYEMGDLRFDSQIEIEGTGSNTFSDGGDSGSLIVDEDLMAMALLFAGGDEGGANGMGLTYANPIQRLLDELKVDLEL